MLEYVKITNHLGEILNLELRNPEKSGFFIRDIQGLGPNKSIINLSESPGLDGAQFNSSRMSYKNIVMDLGFLDDGSQPIELIRQQSYRFFPMNKPITVEVKSDNRHSIITARVETNEPNIFSRESSTIISLLCPSAYFVGKDAVETIFGATSGGFTFPFENPSLTLSLIQFATIPSVSTAASFNYTGDVETGIVMTADITGAVNNLTINYLTKSQSMPLLSSVILAMTGFDLKAGDKVEISTIKGAKYINLIRSGVTTNILNALGANASWFTIQEGTNSFSISATSGVANVIFKIKHQLVYEGL